ncbi:hypothetical protein HDK64DRAFT_309854 [Phyllosticta capitalensis]
MPSLFDKKPCCKPDAPVVVSWKSSPNAQPSYFRHWLPSPTTKATLTMPPVSSSLGWGGKKIDVFLLIGGESMRTVHTRLYTRADPNDENAGPGCPECSCKCKFKGPAEGREDVEICSLDAVPAPVRRAFSHEDELRGDVVEVEFVLEPRPRPVIIAPDDGEEFPLPSTNVSETIYQHLEQLARSRTITMFLPKKFVRTVVPLDSLKTELALGHVETDPALQNIRGFYGRGSGMKGKIIEWDDDKDEEAALPHWHHARGTTLPEIWERRRFKPAGRDPDSGSETASEVYESMAPLFDYWTSAT